MPFHLNWLDVTSWLLEAGLDVTILVLVLFRKPVRQVSFFVAYLVILVLKDTWWYYTLQHMTNIASGAYLTIYKTYWGSDFLLSMLRLATCVQIWWLSVRLYPAIWKLSWRALGIISGLLTLWTFFSVYFVRDRLARFFMLGTERYEFMQAVLLVTILAFSAYYAVDFKPGYRAFLVGFCLYSLTVCVVTTVSYQNLVGSYPWFSHARELMFDGVLCLWFYAAMKLAAAPSPGDPAVPPDLYNQLAPDLNLRLRQLNNQLAGILHS